MIGQYPTPPEGILIANAIRRAHAATSHDAPAGLTPVGVTVGRVIDVPTPPEPAWELPLLRDPSTEPTPIGDEARAVVDAEQRTRYRALPPSRDARGRFVPTGRHRAHNDGGTDG